MQLDLIAKFSNAAGEPFGGAGTVVPDEVIRPRRLVTGDDLIALGLQPGPRFQEILRAVEDAQLEGQIASRDDALKLIGERYLP